MKLIVTVLALVCCTWALPEGGVKRDIQAIKDSCPGKCIMQDKYREYFTQMLPKAKELGKQIAEGGDTAPVIPPLQTEKLDKICQEIGTVKQCVGNCNDPADAEKKQKAEAILTAAADIACDAEIKAQAACLVEVGKVPSPTCNEQCAQFKNPIVEAYNSYKATGQKDWQKAKEAGKNACLLVNCRIKCRKNDIEQKCQAAGYAAAKNLVKKLAVLAQTTHSQFRPSQNFPEECKPEKITEGL